MGIVKQDLYLFGVFFSPVVGNVWRFSLVPGVCCVCSAEGHHKPVAPAAAPVVWERLPRGDTSANSVAVFSHDKRDFFCLFIFNEKMLGPGQRGLVRRVCPEMHPEAAVRIGRSRRGV